MDIRKALSNAGIEVKPLEWEALDYGGAWSSLASGVTYFVINTGFWCRRNGAWNKAGCDIEAAKAAAQADYEHRILATLQLRADAQEPV